MPPERSDAAFLWDMLEPARAVVAFVENRTFEQYLSDLQLRFSVERAVEIVGEAARNVSRPFQEAHPHIPWRIIVAQRHVLAHESGAANRSLFAAL